MKTFSLIVGNVRSICKNLIFIKEYLRGPRVTLLSILNLVGFKKTSFIGNFRLINDFHCSLRSNQRDVSNYYKMWQESDYKFAMGDYHDAIYMRKEILRDLHEGNDYPPIMPENFTIAIGHLALSYLHKIAIEQRILPEGPRFHLLGSRCANLDAFKFVSQGDYVINQRFLEFTGSLLFSPITENLTMFRGIDDFFDVYELWERIGSLQKNNTSYVDSSLYNFQTMPSNFLEREAEVLKLMGISPQSKIAVLHVRDTGDTNDSRNANIVNYRKAIRELIKNDFIVIRIGDSRMRSIDIDETGFFDLTKTKGSGKVSDFALISRCDAFIGTTSGPFGFPLLFGKPTLVTNLTSISRNSLSGKKSIYLPKKIVNKRTKRVWTLEETFQSKISFGGEHSHSQLARKGISLLENTEDEISEATNDLIRSIANGFSIVDSRMKTINKIREEAKSVSYGDFASSFLDGIT